MRTSSADELERDRAPVAARWWWLLVLLWTSAGCDLYGVFPWQVRVPLQDVGAHFTLSDSTWFEDEQTLFVFYRLESEQGLSEFSQIELTYRTDDVFQEFVDIASLEAVHKHVAVDCGEERICGSFSLHVELVPRDVDLQLRYHRDGELVLSAPTEQHIVNSDAPHNSRSAIVYGVFNRENANVQWRLRHQFPAVRNEAAQFLGLRRNFRVEDIAYGDFRDLTPVLEDNPYVYGVLGECPTEFTDHDVPPIETDERAIFDLQALSLDASAAPHVCGTATVLDALGEFSTMALARKNPEVRDAFPSLQTPITENNPVPFFLEVCGNTTSTEHRDMQMQRLFLTEDDVLCINDYASNDFPGQLAATLSEAIDETRDKNADMVLIIGLNRPDIDLIPQQVEAALALILPLENEQSTPRVSGAFLFDTYAHTMTNPAVSRLTLWCPSNLPGDNLENIPDTSSRDCAVQAQLALNFGDASLSSLPILPTEPQFENFIEKYGVGQAGKMTDRSILAPTRTPGTVNVPIEDFAVATFFNNEAISVDRGDAFSYCAEADTGLVVYRIAGFPDALPLVTLGEVHSLIGFTRYELGLLWDFPFLLQMSYETSLAAAVDVPDEVPFIVGFGIATPAEQFAGGFQWMQDSFEIGDALTQCTRFCEHPTFDSATVYNVDELFRAAYPTRCYRPRTPAIGDSGFPPDP